jgi:hypothetical protein
MEISFTEFIFAYSLAECHKKVATIIFYFARAVSHAAVRTDRLCYITSALPPASPKYWINISTVAEKPTALQAGTQKVGGNIRILGQIRALYSQSNFRGKYQHFGLLFFKT